METETTEAYFGDRLPKYRIVYQSPLIVYDPASGSLQSRDGKTIYAPKGRLVARYDPQSFIYLVEKE